VFLCDTNIVSELAKKSPKKSVVAWLERQPELCLSAITVQELTAGIEAAPVQAQRWLREWLEHFVGSPSVSVLPFTRECAVRAGLLIGQGKATGRILPYADAQIAATALVHSAILVTRNTKDFEGLSIPLLNPFL
jgi:predicted nucleic acid-binding protein